MTRPEDKLEAPHPAARLHLRLAATSDLHMNLLGYDYLSDAPSPGVGLARVATRIAEARAEVPGMVLLDNGDFLQGTPMGDFAVHERKTEAQPHPMIAAMNLLRYDAVGLGNHEFDYGLEALEHALKGADFPVLSANALRQRGADPSQDAPLVRPWVLIDRKLPDESGKLHSIRIGVISVLPPQVLKWDKERLEGRMEVRCMIEATRAHVPAIRAAGADVVVALAHCGPSHRPETAGMENALVPIARIEGVDALVAGHVHRLIPGPFYAGLPGLEAEAGLAGGKPVVMPGIAGSHLGLIDLALESAGAGWQVAEVQSSLRPIARRSAKGPVALVAEAPEVQRAMAKDHAATLAFIRRPIGHTEIALQSYTSLAGPCPVIHTINAAQRWYVRRALPDINLPVLSAAAPFKAGGPAGPENFTDIPPGPLTVKNLAALYPFPNTIRAIRVTGADLRDWLERAAGAFNQQMPGGDEQALLNPEFPSYDFDVIAGLTWQIDLSRLARFSHDGQEAATGAGRVRQLSYKGEPVRAEQEFVVATNSHRIGGGGLYAPLANAEVVLAEQISSRDVLMRYIADCGSLREPAKPCWRFGPLGGGSALLETGRGVEAHLGCIAQSGASKVRLGEVNDTGFQSVHITI
ncbi:bifunctional 2',3'-cyclic-nucleotide 2'-phosphodiesterase/3'-nucleotidase [Oceanicola sp. D3]|uniref:bifunctional 2',3'-cyclic-nucleotide 2'-phosphodiesterase/3'-nucleotidase n=1 Tax=Oceanicola sp. D3 TaxID=2587163 RepID=UPI00111D1582|nr:bifunctional 2',3'-cyclic-nucleotide 2'-phosphodiesterase/3'-nucleotidase [Oceanicola sp. D3]QDC08258.1 bifunctional 2',3'-cyclic-nucleotide 2'-phosphodiesterase/3'-nucleotidase [Oceanicola sp. D3]